MIKMPIAIRESAALTLPAKSIEFREPDFPIVSTATLTDSAARVIISPGQQHRCKFFLEFKLNSSKCTYRHYCNRIYFVPRESRRCISPIKLDL